MSKTIRNYRKQIKKSNKLDYEEIIERLEPNKTSISDNIELLNNFTSTCWITPYSNYITYTYTNNTISVISNTP